MTVESNYPIAVAVFSDWLKILAPFFPCFEVESDPNKAWDIWKQIFTCIADSNAPLKKKRVRGISVPWITPELKHDMFQRDRFEKVASRFPSDTDWTYHKQQKNKVNCNVQKAKITYYNNYFKDNSSNIRNTWRGINFMLGNQSKTTTINEIEFNSLTYESPREISGILNKHFSEIGPTLAAKIADTPIKYTDCIKPTEATFILKQTTCAEIFSLINKLPLNKASGLDNISMRLLKEAAPIITSSLTFIINLSIVTGIVPDEWKHASFPRF